MGAARRTAGIPIAPNLRPLRRARIASPAARAQTADRGFTAVELLITIGVAAIFGMLALPSFVDMIRTSRIQTTAEQLQTDLLVARREAIKRNQKVLVCPAKADAAAGDNLCVADRSKWGDGWVVCYANIGTATCNMTAAGTANPNPIVRRGALDPSLYIDTAIGQQYISFEANGKASNDAATSANPNPSSRLKLAGNWNGSSASYFACVQGSGIIAVKKKNPTDSSDPC
jgi:prepilin-type N-terminal cleavage/methylation domain-containing protein